jgi:hypothetical protein
MKRGAERQISKDDDADDEVEVCPTFFSNPTLYAA